MQTKSCPQAPHFETETETHKHYFVLYGKTLTEDKLQLFLQQDKRLNIVDDWCIADNRCVMLTGNDPMQFLPISKQLSLDLAILQSAPTLHQPGLLVMDMDSTTIQIECIDEIAKLAGTGEQVSKITELAMQGELDFKQSLTQRVATLQGAPVSILEQVKQNLPLMPGLIETLEMLQQQGWKVAIASGGFTYFADHLKQQLKLDDVFANQLEIAEGCLTGRVVGDIVDAEYKARTLQQLATQFAIPLTHTLAIGDGANDLPMLAAAGLGVAYHAKEKVQQQAQVIINFADLTALLCILSANGRYNSLTI